MSISDVIDGSMHKTKTGWKLKDDVTNLLASQALFNNSNGNVASVIGGGSLCKSGYFMQTSTPSVSRLSNDASLLSVDTSHVLTHGAGSANNFPEKFDEQIKYLDKQLKQLEATGFNDKTDNTIKSIENFKFDSTNFNTDTNPNPNLQSYRSLCDIKEEEVYYEKIKEKLNQQMEETEKLKQNLLQAKEKSLVVDNGQNVPRYSLLPIFSPKQDAKSQFTNTNTDDELQLKTQLREANSMIDELRINFRSNLIDLQRKLQDCIDEKEKMQAKKEKKIKELTDELKQTNSDFDEYKKAHSQNKIEKTNIDMQKQLYKYQTMFKQLNGIVVAEEKKREKSYFIEDNPPETIEEEANQLFNAILKCFDDYHGEIKHFKNVLRNNESILEEKDRYLEEKGRILKEKEELFEQELNQKIQAIKNDYENIIDDKLAQIELKQHEIDSLNNFMENLKNDNETELYLKEKSINEVKYNYEQQISGLLEEKQSLNYLNEKLKQEFELAKQSELNLLHKYEEQTNLNNLYLREIESLKLNGQNISVAFENFKAQSKSYYQSIEEVNYQLATMKRERQELIVQIENLNKKLENEKYENLTNTNELKRLKDEKALTTIILQKFNKMEQSFTDLLKDQEKLQSLLDQKRKDVQELTRVKEDLEASIRAHEEKHRELDEQKNVLDVNLKELTIKYNTLKNESGNSSISLQQTNKNISMLKDEKETLNRILHDNAIKLKELKNDCDQLQTKLEIKEKLYRDLEIDSELYNKKCDQLHAYNENLTRDKDKLLKELKESRFEVSNLQGNIKSLNKKLMQTIADKDLQISQLKQSLNLSEKEVALLKKFEKLSKNQEDSKVIEVANTMQNKLVQKMQKFELIKAKLVSVELTAENLRKEKAELQDEKSQLESQYITCKSRNEALQQEISHLETIIQEMRKKVSRYEIALDKAAIKYTNLQLSNETLEKEVGKLRSASQATENYSSSSNLLMTHQSQQDKLPQQRQQQQRSQTPDVKSNQNNEVTNEMKTILKEMKHLVFKCNNHVNVTSSRNLTTDSIDEKKIHDDSKLSTQITPAEIYSRLENKLNHLNQIGLDLKKENTGNPFSDCIV